jgi:hypothetical protein
MFVPGGGLGTVDVRIDIRMQPSGRPSPPPREERATYRRGGYEPSSRARADAAELGDPFEPLVDLFQALFSLADAGTRPLRDLVREAVASRRAARARREAMDRMIADWRGREALRGAALSRRLTEGVGEWEGVLPPRRAESLSGSCPAGAVAVAAAPEPPSGSPGHPAGIDPAKLKQLAECKGIEDRIDAACGGDGGCEVKTLRALQYFEKGCHQRWIRLDGARGPTPGVPLLAARRGGVWCVPRQAATPRSLALLLSAAARPEGPPEGPPGPEGKRLFESVKSLLARYVDAIRKMYPDALVGFRGSLATGISKSTNEPPDLQTTDCDGFIVSDELAKRFDPKEGMRFTNRLDDPALDGMSRRIDAALRRLIPRMRGRFNFRVWTTAEYERIVAPAGAVIVGGGQGGRK